MLRDLEDLHPEQTALHVSLSEALTTCSREWRSHEARCTWQQTHDTVMGFAASIVSNAFRDRDPGKVEAWSQEMGQRFAGMLAEHLRDQLQYELDEDD